MPRKNKNKYPPGIGREFIRHCWRHNSYIGQLFLAYRTLLNMASAPSFGEEDRKEAARLSGEIWNLMYNARNARNDSEFERKELK